MRGLQGKGVLITGGSSGIGQATVKRFLEEGCRVFFCGFDQASVDGTLAEFGSLGEVNGIVCDVGSAGDVACLVDAAEKTLQGIDILINNAGVAGDAPFLEMTLEDWDRVMNVNLRGVFMVGQEVGRRMVRRGKGGAIVNMSSTNGLAGEANLAHYNASKGGVLLLTKTMAIELSPYNIRVNALCPGLIWTPLVEATSTPEFIEDYCKNKILLNRLGRPEEVAAAYAFLASDDASFIQGLGLVIDGGQLAHE
jgi:NAD(P)-dependent dehydrogenase (short-subunit alcohol dehydrogenase family)